MAAYLARLMYINGQWTDSIPYAQRVAEVRNALVDRAYPRQLGKPVQYPKGVWNNITQVGSVCGYGCTRKRKRDKLSYGD